MKYRVKEIEGRYCSIYLPQKKYKFIPIWFNFTMKLEHRNKRMYFGTERLAQQWLKKTLNTDN